MTHHTSLIAFGHPAVDAATDAAQALLARGAEVAAQVGNTQPSNALSAAMQALLHVAADQGMSFAEMLAGLSGASSWLILSEPDAEVREHIIEAYRATILHGCRSSAEAETAFNRQPQGNT